MNNHLGWAFWDWMAILGFFTIMVTSVTLATVIPEFIHSILNPISFFSAIIWVTICMIICDWPKYEAKQKMKAHDLCPRCQKFKTRFQKKYMFVLVTTKDNKDELSCLEEFDRKRVCGECYRNMARFLGLVWGVHA